MDTIVAISTPAGSGGIAVVRLSGPEAFAIADRAWQGISLASADTHTVHLGSITDGEGWFLDQAVATVFRAPHSYTGEDTVEFSVHGSVWIQRKVVERLVALGATPAGAGEFTRRAFMNGKMDLSQAEAVADLIAASSRASHRLAMTQMSGTFSRRLDQLRNSLIELASLLELELDFSEEDVTFADRRKLIDIADDTLELIDRLTSTYADGRALKEGVPVAIAGMPNAGKSTLLNRLLEDEKAIVSDIPGTTRDVIEDTCEIGGISFRLFDTAGLRETDDVVENIGIDRARSAIERASIVLWMIDATQNIEEQLQCLDVRNIAHHNQKHIFLLNKIDVSGNLGDSQLNYSSPTAMAEIKGSGLQGPEDSAMATIRISAKTGEGLDELKRKMTEMATGGRNPESELIVTNARHQAALTAGAEALRRARVGIDTGLSADFISQDIREALHHLGTVTGAVTTDTLLQSIFSTFCIGK